MPVDPSAFSGTSFETTNRELADLTTQAVAKAFPLKSNDEKIEVRATNIKVDTSKHDPNDLNAWQEAREQGKSITAPVTADLQLYRDGKRVQSRSNAKIGELPLLGSTGTFMVAGNDWFTPFAQFRLKPGIYSRQKTNGEYEAFMPMQGASMTV
jgi:DNA-directed RNA polymerase beta subunit